MKIVYKCKNTGIVQDSVDLNEFNGYLIQLDYNKISKITEMQYNEVLSKIYFRPTISPIIELVEYNGHAEDRYNNNKTSTLSYRFNGVLYGEYVKYTPEGMLFDKKYYYNGTDVTSDVMNFVGYNGDRDSFKYYTFREDEEFNLMVKYGNYFRFISDSGRKSTDFDRISEYCRKI